MRRVGLTVTISLHRSLKRSSASGSNPGCCQTSRRTKQENSVMQPALLATTRRPFERSLSACQVVNFQRIGSRGSRWIPKAPSTVSQSRVMNTRTYTGPMHTAFRALPTSRKAKGSCRGAWTGPQNGGSTASRANRLGRTTVLPVGPTIPARRSLFCSGTSRQRRSPTNGSACEVRGPCRPRQVTPWVPLKRCAWFLLKFFDFWWRILSPARL